MLSFKFMKCDRESLRDGGLFTWVVPGEKAASEGWSELGGEGYVTWCEAAAQLGQRTRIAVERSRVIGVKPEGLTWRLNLKLKTRIKLEESAARRRWFRTKAATSQLTYGTLLACTWGQGTWRSSAVMGQCLPYASLGKHWAPFLPSSSHVPGTHPGARQVTVCSRIPLKKEHCHLSLQWTSMWDSDDLSITCPLTVNILNRPLP